ncbi:4-hydroxy-tetrahydrodipicolinate synthase [Akkermansiaceae bacterium]|nr:4-hydroxy-tetrahydrodipicolinate synthase [Akkermansiaceae bacterium]
MFHGTFTAITTPFFNGQFDEKAFRNHIELQIKGGVEGILPVGTTGESPTLDEQEHLEVIRVAVEAVDGRVKVIAGTGANSTSEAIRLTEAAEKIGIDATLQVTPYYNKPPQEGLFQHFRAVAECTELPVMLYSVPGRSVVEIAPETAARLAAECNNIIAIKEASGVPQRVDLLKAALPDDFQILSGDDPLAIEFMKRGAVGLVSVASNILPQQISDLVRAMNAGDLAAAQAIHDKYDVLISALMGLETNPIPAKAAVALMGLCSPEIRLPLIPLEVDKLAQLKGYLKDFDLL